MWKAHSLIHHCPAHSLAGMCLGISIVFGVLMQNAMPAIPENFSLPTRPRPWIAATPAELARLKTWGLKLEEAPPPVQSMVSQAMKALVKEHVFPPRGGAHNQNYQCPAHQIGLVTVDGEHHRCPVDGKIFSGEPFDDVVFSRVHGNNLNDALRCAWAWRITGREAFFARAVLILGGYAERYEGYPLHSALHGGKVSASSGRLFPQTLDEGSCASSTIGPAYDLIEAALSDESRSRIQDGLLRPMVKTIAKAKAGKGNWQSYHNAGLFALGAGLGDLELMRATIEDPANGFDFQMTASISEEGMWYESSWAYHYYTLDALAPHAEAARRVGIDLWAAEPLRRMCILPARYAMPDGRLPRFGDDPGTAALSSQSSLEAAAAATGDARLLEILPPNPDFTGYLLGRVPKEGTQTKVALGSEALLGAGHAFLRTGGKEGLAAVIGFGPDGGFHGHFDKLAFVFYAFGKELGVDAGRAKSQAYHLPIHKLWYRASLGHNVLLVDRRGQSPTQGHLDFFVTNDAYAAAGVSAPGAYSNAVLRRIFLQTEKLLLIHDVIESTDDQAHDFQWLYHGMGSNLLAEGLKPAEAPQDFPGMEFAKDFRIGDYPSGVRLAFEGSAPMNLVLDAAPVQLLATHGPLGSILERVPFVVATRRGKRAEFTACLEPLASGAAASVTSVSARREPGALVFVVERETEPKNQTFRLANVKP